MKLFLSLLLFVIAGIFFMWALSYLAIALVIFGIVLLGGILFLVIRLIYCLLWY